MTVEQTVAPVGRAGDFWIYWAGQLLSQVGSALTAFALPLLVFKISGSALALGISTAAAWLPYLVLGLPIGTWVDRINRKAFMISLDIIRATLLAILPTLALLGHLPLWWIYVVLFLNATLSIGFSSAGSAAVASLIQPERLVQANGFVQVGAWLSLVIGPLLASLLLTRISLQGVLWVDAISFLISAVSLVLVRTSFNRTPPRERAKTPFGRDLLEGLHTVLAHPVLRTVALVGFLANLALGTIVAQLVLVAKHIFSASDAQVGVFATALGIGGVIASLLAGPLKRWLSYGVLLLGSLLLFGILTLVLVLMHNYWVGVVLWACMFGMIGFINAVSPAIVQAVTPNEVLGRVTACIGVLAILPVPISAILGGWLIDQLHSVSLVLGVLGSCVTLGALIFLLSPLAHVERYLSPALQSDAQSEAVPSP